MAAERTSVDVLQDLIGAFKTRAWSNVCEETTAEETTEETTEPPETKDPVETIEYETKVLPFISDPPYHHEETTEETTEPKPCNLACGADMQLDETACLCKCIDPQKHISGDTCVCNTEFVNVQGVCCSPCTNSAQEVVLTTNGSCDCTCKDIDASCGAKGGTWDKETCQCLCGTSVWTTDQCCINDTVMIPGADCGTNKVLNSDCQCDCAVGTTSLGDVCCAQCDNDKEATTDAGGACTCACPSDKVPIGDICCAQCDNDKEATTDAGGACTCACPSDTVPIGDICCATCDNDKEATTDASGACTCACPKIPECESNYQKDEQCHCICAPDCASGWIGQETKSGCRCVCASCAIDTEGRPYCPSTEQTTAMSFSVVWDERTKA